MATTVQVAFSKHNVISFGTVSKASTDYFDVALLDAVNIRGIGVYLSSAIKPSTHFYIAAKAYECYTLLLYKIFHSRYHYLGFGL